MFRDTGMPQIPNFLSRSKATSQPQKPHGQTATSLPPTTLANSKTSAYDQTKEAHTKPPQTTTSNVTSTKERELSRQLLKKEAEIGKLHTHYEGRVSRKENQIQNLLHDQTVLRGASEKKDSDLLKSSNGFKAMLDEKDKKIDELRGYYNGIVHAQEGQQRDSKVLQRNADAEAEALRDRLRAAEQELELCRDDLFRMQPVCRMCDGDIMAAFESLGEQLVNWIDHEISTFEKANPHTPVGWLFSGSEDSNVVCFLWTYPIAGEHLCRHLINRYLLDCMFGSEIHNLGLSAEYTHMRLEIEQGMAALKPPRGTRAHLLNLLIVVLILTVSDSQTINTWRAETLSALGATQDYKDLKEEQSIQWTKSLFESLSAYCPKFFGREGAMKEFHDQVTIPATTLVSQLQGLASPYSLKIVEKDFLDYKPFTKDDLRRVIAIDLETGRTLKPGSTIVSNREGVIGEFVLSLEPSVHRVNEGTSETKLRQETWLVRLDIG